MYSPKHFEETNAEAMKQLIASAPLATFVVSGADGIVANHIPFVLAGNELSSSRLLAHIPRANPLSDTLRAPIKCLTIFHGPEGYISPSYYATKPKHGKVVPTWNYSVVHIHGTVQIIEDPEWILNQMELLTELNESPRSAPWAIADAPKEFINTLLNSLLGLEVSIERIEAKTKASQNQPEENQKSVLEFMDSERANDELTKFMHSVLKK